MDWADEKALELVNQVDLDFLFTEFQPLLADALREAYQKGRDDEHQVDDRD